MLFNVNNKLQFVINKNKNIFSQNLSSKNNVSQKIPKSGFRKIIFKKKLFQKLSKKFENFGIFKFGKNKYSGIKKFLTSDQKIFSDETHLVDFGTSNKVQENVCPVTLRHGQSPNRRWTLTTPV